SWQIRQRQHEPLEPGLDVGEGTFSGANRFAHFFAFTHQCRRVAAAFLDLADLAGQTVFLFLEPLDVRQRIAPLAVEGHEFDPIDRAAPRRHTHLHFVDLFPQRFYVQPSRSLRQPRSIFYTFAYRLAALHAFSADLQADIY